MQPSLGRQALLTWRASVSLIYSAWLRWGGWRRGALVIGQLGGQRGPYDEGGADPAQGAPPLAQQRVGQARAPQRLRRVDDGRHR